jgi:anti-anti-sigma regulatory factor
VSSAATSAPLAWKVESDPARNRFGITYYGSVKRDDTEACLASVKNVLPQLQPGFRVLVDLSALESMDPKCATSISAIMDACNAHGVDAIIRIIPDQHRDIGFQILSLFHYDRRVRTMICANMEEALDAMDG